eukprot:Nitzschia sp. Nitz4//scaffold358_size24170//15184//15660//NITZ4_008430-RA/size24170-processed-gene-0.34-mRNA-1//-1//CDS//3329548999//6431//frame0
MASFGLGNAAAAAQQPVEPTTPWMAASEGNLPLVQSSLAALNLTVNAADEAGYTLLHAAASYGKTNVLQFLLSSNVNVRQADNDGDTALHYADSVEAARWLVEQAKADPNQRNNSGKTALEAKKADLEEMMADEDLEDDDDDFLALKAVVGYLSTLAV